MVISRCRNARGHWKLPLASPQTRPLSGGFCAGAGTHKKAAGCHRAVARSCQRAAQKRVQAHPDRRVSIDETSVKTNLTRQDGRNFCAKRLEMDAPFGAWVKPAMDGKACKANVRNVLAPELLPGTVVICDNLAKHFNKAATAALRDLGCWFLYLPPYSPDLNLIARACRLVLAIGTASSGVSGDGLKRAYSSVFSTP